MIGDLGFNCVCVRVCVCVCADFVCCNGFQWWQKGETKIS